MTTMEIINLTILMAGYFLMGWNARKGWMLVITVILLGAAHITQESVIKEQLTKKEDAAHNIPKQFHGSPNL